jgi:AcrR family transcriptional regulator
VVTSDRKGRIVRRDGAANRDRILSAAEQVFGGAGPAGSTEEVARLAGVGIATVFRHFPTKRDLVEATAVRYLETLEAEIRTLPIEPDPGAAFGALLRKLVSSGSTKVTLLNLMLADGNEITEPVLAALQGFRGAAGQSLERAQSSGVIRRDVTVDEIFTLGRALAHVHTPEHRDGVDRAVEIVLDGLGVRR